MVEATTSADGVGETAATISPCPSSAWAVVTPAQTNGTAGLGTK